MTGKHIVLKVELVQSLPCFQTDADADADTDADADADANTDADDL